MTHNCTTVTDDTFSVEIQKDSQPIVMAFTATWCGLCHIMETIIDRLASQFSENIKFCKINFDRNPALKERYGIHELPTLLIFYKGELVDYRCGAVSQDELSGMLHKILGGLT